jgi:ABC-type branched-subunit amino acid transport system substrate-binding protein
VIGARKTKELITLTLVPPDSGQLVGVIGAYSSDLSKVIADFLRVFEIPQISYGSTASVLSDKTIYSYFFRTVPPDTQQAIAMADICVKLGWKYVITINSYGLYGEKGIEDFRDAANTHEICIAQQLTLSAFPSEQELDELVKKMRDTDRGEEYSAHAVVMFIDIRDARMILKALKRNKITKRFYWIGSDGWGNNLNAVGNFESFAEGAITLTQLDTPVKGFYKYFKNLNVYDSSNSNNSWLKEFWESHFYCKLPGSVHNFDKNCSGNERLASSQFPFAPVQTVVNAVYAIAHALHNYMADHCDGSDCKKLRIDRRILVQYLRNVSFEDQATGELLKFDKKQEISRSYTIHNFQKSNNGSYMYRQVGIWNLQHGLELSLSNLSWAINGSKTPVSICNAACPNGQYRQRKGNHDITCCWECVPCMSREIVNSMYNTCFECPFGEVPDTNQSYCMALPTLETLSDGSSQALVAVSVLGLIFVIIVAAIFFGHSNVPLIKASSRELSGIILLGLALLFIYPWLLVAKPTPSLCICHPIILGVALASCYAPLFMKILRIYRIFKTARKSAGKPILISPTSQVLIAIGLITIQLLFSLISFFPTPPEPVVREINNHESLFLECSMGKDVFATLLCYNMFLMLLCTIMAFKTRKFPRNFNEAKYIGFTMYFTCFVWIIFFPSYLSSGNGLGRIIWECSAIVFIGWITLIGLFGPKICHLVLSNHLSSTADQLAVTTNTVSQAAVVMPSNNTESSVDTQVKREDLNENVKTDEEKSKNQRNAETTPC